METLNLTGSEIHDLELGLRMLIGERQRTITENTLRNPQYMAEEGTRIMRERALLDRIVALDIRYPAQFEAHIQDENTCVRCGAPATTCNASDLYVCAHC